MLRKIALNVCAAATGVFGLAGLWGVVRGELEPATLIFSVSMIVTGFRAFGKLANAEVAA